MSLCGICELNKTMSIGSVKTLPVKELVCPCSHTQLILASKLSGNQHQISIPRRVTTKLCKRN
ncbi:unnamed protein product, partial [Vitis vinifera]|uniref:Uncharacterized protein n=1 Tax=Vitis vinifera TaxID=29760 RepID=D7SRH8_VITVI